MSMLRTEVKGDVLVVYFTEARILDEATAGQVGKYLMAAAERATSNHLKLVLNFQGVAFLASAMIGQVIQLHKKCKSDGVGLALCNLLPNVMEVFKVMTLQRVLSIFDDEARAIAAFDKGTIEPLEGAAKQTSTAHVRVDGSSFATAAGNLNQSRPARSSLDT